ncbi:MAG: S8/S53 family peptidase [Candidatus Eremiobacteraeota bacterium]|nr:S8/S53 family peptidase [Candidatus Eremiobacteraeota bacterium]
MAERWVVPGSQREHLPGTRILGDADPIPRITVTIIVRSKSSEAPPAGAISRQAFAERYGADQSDLGKVEDFARAHGLHVVESNSGRRSVVVAGSVAALSAAFGVTLKCCQAGDIMYRGREGAITLPSNLAGIVEAVLGLDDRPQAASRARIATQPAATFTPPQIARLYDFPLGLDGTGQCVGIVELGGGFSQTDFGAYLSGLGVPAQNVTIVSVDGAQNAPGQDNNADVEVMLDAEIVGAVAPGARIVIYFAPNTDQGFVDAVTTAIHDRNNAPSIVSISWGAAEANWTQQGRDALNSAIAAAQAMAVTVCAASGDGGSSDGVNDGAAHADFPASSPYVLGCGGTTLSASAQTISSEVAWSDSGGGVSSFFALPAWQSGSNVPAPPANSSGGRGVPDVSGDADPNTGYQIQVDGSALVAGGTSAVAPLWAALIALMNQKRGSNVGFVNPKLYALQGAANNPAPFHDITSGTNGAYAAAPGWDPCTGLGTPEGSRLVQSLASAP